MKELHEKAQKDRDDMFWRRITLLAMVLSAGFMVWLLLELV